MSDQKWEPKVKQPTWHKIKSVDPNTKRRNLIVKVMEVNPVEGKSFVEVVIGDDSAILTARFLEEQIPLAKVGEFIRMQNARVSMYQGHIRVECDKWSKLASHEKQDWAVNEKEDISKVEFELVDRP
eukprot:GEMP01025594.1.p1 GENE.GEMP01025594.1~~GEMP01025594.1.p1  ORF type:complete len:127 (+),score=30.18 GEMP01025594.1:59-439(+)